jgi:hypothetical protein
VTCRWAGLDLVARIGPTTVTIVGGDGTRIVHPRKRFRPRSIDYRHYATTLLVQLSLLESRRGANFVLCTASACDGPKRQISLVSRPRKSLQ